MRRRYCEHDRVIISGCALSVIKFKNKSFLTLKFNIKCLFFFSWNGERERESGNVRQIKQSYYLHMHFG